MSQHDGTGDSKRKGGAPRPKRRREKPGWADGLRRLYDSVVEEPLPDSFNELLKKLDEASDE